MRLSDVYLMYAESAMMASNSATGKADNYGKTAVDAINIVRDRAGVGHVDAKFLSSATHCYPNYGESVLWNSPLKVIVLMICDAGCY
jgi:hypothetical protein